MQAILTQLNAVPGVVGSLVCRADGALVADAFPPVFDRGALASASKSVAESAAGLATATGPVRMLDLRYGAGRIVVRPIAGAHLCILCSASTNLQTLAMSASVAAPRLEQVLANGAAPKAEPAPPRASQLYATVQRIEAAIKRKHLDLFKARGEIALKAGFALGFIDEDTPDDAEKLAKLKAAAAAVLGERF